MRFVALFLAATCIAWDARADDGPTPSIAKREIQRPMADVYRIVTSTSEWGALVPELFGPKADPVAVDVNVSHDAAGEHVKATSPSLTLEIVLQPHGASTSVEVRLLHMTGDAVDPQQGALADAFAANLEKKLAPPPPPAP